MVWLLRRWLGIKLVCSHKHIGPNSIFQLVEQLAIKPKTGRIIKLPFVLQRLFFVCEDCGVVLWVKGTERRIPFTPGMADNLPLRIALKETANDQRN